MQGREEKVDLGDERIHFHDFPSHLAEYVREKWENLIAGDYTPPLLPSEPQLQHLLEVAYLAGMEADESRPLKFTLCCTPEIDQVHRQHQAELIEAWPFAVDRPFTVQEIRRLSVATGLDDSAIWIRFPASRETSLSVHGLLNFGSSWSVARNAFSYHYENLPDALLIRVQSPGRVTVYQGMFSIASLQSGKLSTSDLGPLMDMLGVYPLFEEGSDLLRQEIEEPTYETPRDWLEFEWLAYVNTVLAIVNSIQLKGHGGAVIFASQESNLVDEGLVKIKYRLGQEAGHLGQHFINFMTLRHRFGDMVSLEENEAKDAPTEEQLRLTDYMLQEAQRSLAETCEFIGTLSGTDGALVVRTSLSVDGFGTEILLDKVKPAEVYKVTDPMGREREKLDSEQFGMRHRSAMRLCSAAHNLAVFVISQDGGVSLVWNDKGDVCFRSGVKTTNVNMVLA